MSVEWLSALEGGLKRKDEELELSKGVEAQCCNLYDWDDNLQDQLGERQLVAYGLLEELAIKQQLIEVVESSRRQA